MMHYDVLLIHPPAIYDFREKVIFYGPIALTVSESTNQFMTPPVGMLSIADYLDRNGYKVLVDNINERMITSESFDATGVLFDADDSIGFETVLYLVPSLSCVAIEWCG